MNKNLKRSIVAMLAITASLSADVISEGKASGSIQQQYRLGGGSANINSFDTFSTAGNVKFETKKTGPVYGAVNFYGIGDLGLNNNEISNQHLDHGKEYTILNEAYIGASLDKLGVKGSIEAGRFFMDSALVSSVRNLRYDLPIPNSFEGIKASANPMTGLTVNAAWINGMSGVDNQGDKTKFENIDTVAGNYNSGLEGKSSNGLYLIGAKYDINKDISILFEDRYVQNYSNVFYQEASIALSPYNLKIVQQYINEDSNRNTMGANTFGLKATASMDKFEGTVAMNYTNGLLSGFNYGSDPLFTSMNTGNSYNDEDSRGLMAELKYKACDKDSFKVAYANFKGNSMDKDVVEITASHKMNSNIAFNSVAAYSQNNNNNTEEASFRILAAYSF